MTKLCAKCKVEKPATPENFTKNRTKPDGLQTECRSCRKVLVDPKNREYREESKKTASQAKQPWTAADLATAQDRSMTIMEAAARLGRTFNSVAGKRRKVPS